MIAGRYMQQKKHHDDRSSDHPGGTAQDSGTAAALHAGPRLGSLELRLVGVTCERLGG